MTALPLPPAQLPPPRLLTIAEYAALGETESGYTELQEGRLVMSPSPVPKHNIALGELFTQLRAQVPRHVRVVPDVDVDLQLAAARAPGSARRPDLVIVERTGLDRVEEEGGLLRASEVVIAIEVVSPGSRRTDHVIKRVEYADAGIPHYWIVDLDEPVSLIACHLAGDLGYQDRGSVTGGFTTDDPFPVRIDLDALL